MHLTDEQCDAIEDAIEYALLMHQSLNNDSRCSCGAENNMDGDVLHGHRLGEISHAVMCATARL